MLPFQHFGAEPLIGEPLDRVGEGILCLFERDEMLFCCGEGGGIICAELIGMVEGGSVNGYE